MSIRTEIVRVTTTGSNGSAAGSATSVALNGELIDIHLDYHATAPNTTDVTIAYGTPGLGTIATNADSATDVLLAPRQELPSASGNWELYPLNGTITVAVAECNALAPAVVATIRYWG